MARPPLDAEAMRALAVRMAKGRPEIYKRLRWFIEGKAAAVDSLGVFRRAVQALLFGDEYQIDHQLKIDLQAWAATYTLDVRGTDDPFVAKTTIRLRDGEMESYTEAAGLLGVDIAEFVRMGANALAEQVRAEAKGKSQAA